MTRNRSPGTVSPVSIPVAAHPTIELPRWLETLTACGVDAQLLDVPDQLDVSFPNE